MLFLAWAVLSAAIIVTFDFWSFAQGRRGWRRFLSTFLLFYAQVILSEVLLGLLGVLTAAALFLINVLAVVVILVSTRRTYRQLTVSGYLQASLRAIRQYVGEALKDPFFLVLFLIAAAFISWVIFLGVIFPITDVDGNAYHMTFIAQAIQNHNIFDAPTSITWLAGYPKGGEFIQMWNVLIPNNDALADLAQMPFVLLGVVSLYAIALQLRVAKKDARFASLLFVFIPVVINQAKTTYVDVVFCALFFAGLAMSLKKKPTHLDLLLVGIVFGLLMSVKSTGLLLVAACLPFLLSNIVTIERGKILADYKKYLTIFLLMAPAVALSLVWYVKDWVVYGSPLYPFGLKIAGLSVFPGKSFQDFIAGAFSNFSVMPPGMLQRIWFVWTEQKDWFGCLYNYDATFSGLGPVWFVLLIPSILVAVAIAVKRRNYLLLWLTGIIGLVFLAYPANFYSRYAIFIVVVGVAAFGLVMTALDTTAKTLVRLVVLWLVLTVVGTSFTLCNFTPGVIRDQLASLRNGHGSRGGIAYHNAVGDAYIFMLGRLQPGDVVVYDSSPYFVYPLWRSDFANRVVYIPAKDRSTWLAGLRRDHAQYVFTEITSKEHAWASAKFRTIYKDNTYEIYELR